MNSFADSYETRLGTLAEEWGRANDAVKRLELLRANGDALSVAAIKELRDAGFHVVEAQNPKRAEDDRLKQIQDAIDHCRRAHYDAVESEVWYYIDSVKAWLEAYGQLIQAGDLPDTVDPWLAAKAGQDLVRQAQGDERRNDEDGVCHTLSGRRQTYLDRIVEVRDSLGQVDAVLDSRRPLMNHRARINGFAKMAFVVALAGAVFAGVAAGAEVVQAWLQWDEDAPRDAQECAEGAGQ